MLKNFIPSLSWLSSYNKKQFLGDLPAGLTVGIMLIPQGMAYAMIAGLPPVYGLYASLVPQVIYAFLGTSRQLAVGPVAMDSLLVASGLSLMAVSGSESYILLAVVLAFLMGLMQLLMGVFRLGFLVNFLSKPVISGFTSAAALIIGLNQLKHLLGIKLARSNRIHELVINAFTHVTEIHLLTFTIGIVGVLVIYGLKKFAPKIPGALLVVVLGILSVTIFNLAGENVQIVGFIPEGLPEFKIPELGVGNVWDLLSIAVTLALIAFMEAISVAKAIEQKHSDYKVDPNQELIALGTSNLVASFFQSYPTTGGFSRTAVNDQAGARTGVSALIAALVVGLTLLFLTPLFYNLPKAILASIIMVAVFGLIDFKYPLRLWKNRKDEFILLTFTFLITLTVGIKEGVMLGVLLSLLILIYRTTKPHMVVLGKFKGQNLYKNIARFEQLEERKDVLIVRFDAQLYFANANFFKENLNELIKERGAGLKMLVLSAEAINYIDSSAANMLRVNFKEILDQQIEIKITNAIGPVRDIFKKSEITALIGRDNFHLTVNQAVRSFDGENIEQQHQIVLQNNL
jgi:SulP family sulfate permease